VIIRSTELSHSSTDHPIHLDVVAIPPKCRSDVDPPRYGVLADHCLAPTASRGGPYCLLPCRFAPSFPSAQQRFFRCGGDPIQRREERARCGKQRIVFLEGGEIQQRLSVQLVSGHAIPDALHCLRNRSPNCGANLFELPPDRLGLRGNVLVNRHGNALFHTLILCFGLRFFLADIVWPSTPSGDPFHTGSVILFIELFCIERCLGPVREVGIATGMEGECRRLDGRRRARFSVLIRNSWPIYLILHRFYL